MNVGFQHGNNLPAAPAGLLEIDGRLKRRVKHKGDSPIADQIGEAALAGAPDLDDLPPLFFLPRPRLGGAA